MRYSEKEKKEWLKTYFQNWNQAETCRIHNIPRSSLNYYLRNNPDIPNLRFSPEEMEYWCNLYELPLNTVAIEKITGRARKTLRDLFISVGIYREPPKIDEDIFSLIEIDYAKAIPVGEIANKYSISTASIYKHLHKKGITRTIEKTFELRLGKEHHYFDEIDKEDKAYWLGFIVADGSVSKRSVTISLSEVDGCHLRKIGSIFNVRLREHTRIRSNNKSSAMVTMAFNSTYMCRVLLDYGLILNKRYSIKLGNVFDCISKSYMRHFIRGLWDGDGSILLYKSYNKLYQKYYYKRSVSISGNIDLLKRTSYEISKELGIKKHRVYPQKQSKNAGILAYQSKENILKLLNWLYGDSTVYLERKQNSAMELIANCTIAK